MFDDFRGVRRSRVQRGVGCGNLVREFLDSHEILLHRISGGAKARLAIVVDHGINIEVRIPVKPRGYIIIQALSRPVMSAGIEIGSNH